MARDPKAEVEITAQSRSLGAKLREARAKFGTFGAELKKNVFGKDLVEKGFWSKAGAQIVGNIGTNALGAIGGLLKEQGMAAYKFDDALARLQITANKTPAYMADFAASVRRSSDETGISADQILGAAQNYVALTGDMDGAAASARQWARVAQATNSSVGDISATAAALKQNLAIKPGEMEEAFSALTVQGKEGAIELKDLAAQLSTIAPQWAQFRGGTGVGGLRELGAALQVVKRGFGGDAAETVTGLQSLLTAVVKNSGRLKGAGVRVFDVDPKTHMKTMRNVLDIVRDIGNSKLAKDPTKLEKAFGRVEAYRAYLQLAQNRDVLDDLIAKSNDADVINRDLSTYLNTTAGRTQVAWERAKNEIQAAFTPERIELFAGAISKAVSGLASLVNVGGKVIGGASDFGKGLAKIVGGQSEDDRIQGIKDKRWEERVSSMEAAYNMQHFGEDWASSDYQEQRAAAVRRQLGMEESLKDRLRTQLGGGTMDRRLYEDAVAPSWSNGFQGHGARVTSKGNYSIDELIALSTSKTVNESSDSKMIQQFITQALIKAFNDAIEKQTLQLAKTVGKGVSVDGKTLVDAHRNSREHGRRP